MTIQVKVTVDWSEEDLFEAVYYSGVDTYPWWVGLEGGATPDDYTVKVTAWDPESDDDMYEHLTRIVTLEDVSRAMNEVAATIPSSVPFIMSQDIDSDLADAILQMAVYGEVVYG